MSERRSLEERARGVRGALLLGCGGGGDIVQTLPVMNYLRRLGVEGFVLADYGLQWWDRPGHLSLGCQVVSLDRLTAAERIHPDAAVVSAATRVANEAGGDRITYEAVVAELFDVHAATVSLEHGAQGVLSAARALMDRFDLSLFVTVDIGADGFYSGEETTVQSPLADAISIHVARRLDGVYALAGYGCDAEIAHSQLDRNVARAMRAGAFLGAHGLTPEDVEALGAVLERFPNEMIEHWPREAALGRLGSHPCKVWWSIEVTPLAAVTLFFDPKGVMGVNPLPELIGETASLEEAEDLIATKFDLVPETRLPVAVPLPAGDDPVSGLPQKTPSHRADWDSTKKGVKGGKSRP